MKKILFAAVAMVSALSVFSAGMSDPGAGDPVTQWNLITVRATKIAGLNSNLGSRIEAIEAIAVYDAVNSIRHFGTAYHYYVSPKGAASAQAAVAQAAHDVLVNYFPGQRPSLDSALAGSLSIVSDGPVGEGLSVGAAAAADIIALRAADGASPNSTYAGPAAPGIGQYRPTPAGFAPGINQQWGVVKPFLIRSGTQFRPLTPPAPGSAEFRKALAEVAEIGSVNSTTRTVEQTHIAQFYKQDAELTVNEAARVLALQHGLSLEENAYIFLLTDIAEADARIAIWDGKYSYLFWRPVTALNAGPDGTVTNNYSTWTPLVSTPPHPSYPCGHCGTVTAGFDVLKTFYGDKNNIELHTATAGEPARVIHSLSEGEEQNGHSRIYGGIHYSFENEAAQDIGRKIAGYVLANGPKKNEK